MENELIKGGNGAAKYIRPKVGDLQYEEFWIIYLHRRNSVLGAEYHPMGGMTGTVIDFV